MDLVHTLLSSLASLLTTLVVTVSIFVGNLSGTAQKIVILPPAPAPIATTSSSALLTSSATSSASKTIKTAKPVQKTAAAAASSTTSLPAPTPTSTITPEALNSQTRAALVNILCIAQNSGAAHSISGSGVIIDDRGVVLTNAHIGQYFLIQDYPTKGSIDCSIRVGSPAQPRYRATLLFLPPPWIIDNGYKIAAEQAMGTGENDYAFLLITGPTGSIPLPSAFPYLPMLVNEPAEGTAEFLAAYPAGFLNGLTIEKDLYPASAYATVKELFTFSDARTVDLVSVGGTIVSQGGSSGGAMVRTSDGKLQGIIATATSADTTAQRDLRAITLGHIDRSLTALGQKGIAALLSQDLVQAAANFAANIAPTEKETLVQALKK